MNILVQLQIRTTGSWSYNRTPMFSSKARILLLAALAGSAMAAPRQHTITFGRWQQVASPGESGGSERIRVRTLLVDDRPREYTSGPVHEVTDKLFVVRKAYRLNDTLPQEKNQAARWIWKLGGWISVDRLTGHISQLNLPGFDPDSSEAIWYRDYAAYCGSSDDGGKMYLMVAQLGKKKPVLKQEYSGSGCEIPHWERTPGRVTFAVAGSKSTFLVHAHSADLQTTADDEEEGPQ